MNLPLEIERKWMVSGWPEQLPLIKTEQMRQGYLTVRPTVRIREEILFDADGQIAKTEYILCFKRGDGLVRKELEFPVSKEQFLQLEALISLPLIPKIRNSYQLPDGLILEVNHVDEGLPTEFWYAEVEFPSKEVAAAWVPPAEELLYYLNNEVTDQPGQSMGAYWEYTREQKGDTPWNSKT